MEERLNLKRFNIEGDVNKEEENRVESDGEDVRKVGNMRVHDDEDNTFKGLSPSPKHLSTIKQEDQLESAKAKMCAVREENERLKMLLARVVKQYKSLEMHFFDIVQQEQKPIHTTSTLDQVEEPHDLVFLSLGRSSSDIVKEEKRSNSSKSKENEDLKEGLALGLVSKFKVSNSCGIETSSNQTLEKRFNYSKEEETREQRALGKIHKPTGSKEDEVLQPSHSEKTRVSVRARCDTPTMNDGCQWRKYGQKLSKGNPCPRGYYRCTVGPTCPVRKKVQRCAEDMSILITTYEGNHNHPLPMSATAMASTTTAAACMQMSSSTSSRPEPRASMTNTSTNFHNLNFNISDNCSSRQFYSPIPSFSSPYSHPTITLDLTVPPSSSSLYAPSQFNRCTPTSLNFSSLDTNVPTSWSNVYSSYGRQNQQYIPCMANSNQPPTQQSVGTEAIAAATNAITSDPSFRIALEAAITSIVGGGIERQNGSNIGKALKRGESFPVNSVYSSSNMNWNGCESTYLDNTSSSSSKIKEGRQMFLPPPSLPFSSNSRAPEAPVEENVKKGA